MNSIVAPQFTKEESLRSSLQILKEYAMDLLNN